MTELDEEVKAQVRAALDEGDIDQIHSILDALEEAEHPEMVKVEFTRSQYADLDYGGRLHAELQENREGNR
jgi:N-methylhydantoinase A/oxoprolinase/acetone carboxylase beta subunit